MVSTVIDVRTGALVVLDATPEPEPPLSDVQAAATASVNAAIGQVRARYITVLPGQEMLYLAKESEAKAWLAAVDPDPADFPLISAEVGITAPDAEGVAETYVTLAAQWRQIAAALEALRLGTLARIEAAGDAPAVAAILDAFPAALAALTGQLPG